MRNFYLRFLSSILLVPIILISVYENSYFFYILLTIILILGFYEILKNVNSRILCFFLCILLMCFIYSFISIRGNNFNNYIICLWILVLTWLTDIGGYIVGKLIGGKKLTKFSPNKTISGLFGSIIFAQFSILIPIFFLQNFNISYEIIVIQLFLSLVSIFGDIFFSYIKRINDIKDYSNLIPGHGGVLDRIDGMIFVIIFYNFLIY